MKSWENKRAEVVLDADLLGATRSLLLYAEVQNSLETMLEFPALFIPYCKQVLKLRHPIILSTGGVVRQSPQMRIEDYDEDFIISTFFRDHSSIEYVVTAVIPPDYTDDHSPGITSIYAGSVWRGWSDQLFERKG